MKKSLATLSALALTLATPALAENWSLVGDASKVAFGSIKKDTVGEVHHFSGLSGTVDEDGKVSIEIDVASVETWIDIRNERMQKMVLSAAPKAMLATQIDAEALSALKPGDTTTIDVEGTLTLNGNDVEIETSLFVARLSEKKMMATTDEMIMLSMKEAGIDDGITKLMEVAKLPSITRVSPVTLRLVFEATGETKVAATAAAPAAAEKPADTQMAAISGDADAGKKVFRKCKACHVVDSDKNKVGPSLQGVIGRQIASVEGFKYSKAFMEADLVWTPENLAEYLKKPRAYIKGTKMAFGGLKKDADIENVIAYINSEAK